ncbi:hypothetical protein [Variovorax sp. ZT4R33]|uniref:hypothetical protein n=1 Tax=Variovorax sp. ZT4R33 TaxID=3443743 RepID=UPI003F47DC57
MRNLPLRRRLALTALVLLPLPWHLWAQDLPPLTARPAAPAFAAAPVDADTLSALRGGTDITHNDMRLDGITAGNVANHVATGNNTITGGAFSGMSGLPLVVQNSGANVLIQNAVIVNVKMQ